MSYPKTPFHLSVGVHSMDESVHFFVELLGAKVLHRDASGYVNLGLGSCQITLKSNATVNPQLPDFHFGINLDLENFDSMAERALTEFQERVVMPPKVVDAGTPLERKKMYLKCPTGYLVEIKGYRELEGL